MIGKAWKRIVHSPEGNWERGTDDAAPSGTACRKDPRGALRDGELEQGAGDMSGQPGREEAMNHWQDDFVFLLAKSEKEHWES